MPILEWLDKDKAMKKADNIPYKILKYNKELSYGDNSENMIIKGDNLEALKALLPYYKGQVKCIYIDPPYNTGNAFEHYDDNLEHSIWLSLMYPRLELLHELLAEDGFLCCHIDDAEGAYLKIILDEIFGRNNYLNTFYIQVRYSDKTLKSDMNFHKQIEQIHIYRKNKQAAPNLPTEELGLEKYIYEVKEISEGKTIEIDEKRVDIFNKNQYKIIKHSTCSNSYLKEIWASGTILDGNSSGRFFRDYLSKRNGIDELGTLYKVYGIGDDAFPYRYFTGPKRIGATKGKYYQGVPLEKLNNNSKKTIPIENFYDFSANFGNCRLEGNVDFRSGKKPEILLKMIFTYFSSKGDLILDSFLGSGTTCAVAHKMGRRYIGIEMGQHAITHCVPRLKAVIDGEQGGISKSQNWQGGGGYSFYELGETLFDENGNINKEVSFETLARHIWFSETKNSNAENFDSPLLGIFEDTAYYLIYNNTKDENILNKEILESLPEFFGPKVIYADLCRINTEVLKQSNIIFKQIPYSIKAR